MAELAKLDIVLGADAKPAVRAFDQVADAAKRSTAQVQKFGTSVQNASKGASAALFSVSQVARDLPFGFIAIQNNLPVLVDAFSNLSKQSGGVVNGFKALAGAVAGPAGIGLAFSVLTSAVTSLVQQYGSMGAAIKGILLINDAAAGATKRYVAAQKEAIAGAQSEILILNTLVRTLTDGNKSQEERHGAYVRLKKEYPGIIQNMTEENALSSQGNELIKQRAAELIKYIKLKAQESALSKLLEEAYKKQQEALTDLTSSDGFDQFFSGVKAGFKSIISGKSVGEAFAKPFTDATKEIDIYSKRLAALVDDQNKIDPKVTGLDSFKESAKSADESLRKLLESRKRLLEEELKKTNIVRDAWLTLSKELAAIELQIKLIGVKDPETIRNTKEEFQNKVDGLGPLQMQAKIEAGQIDFQSLLNVDEKEATKRISDIVSSILRTGFEDAAKKAGGVRGGVQIIPSESVRNAIETVKALKAQLTDIANYVGGTLADAFGALWEKFATEGKLSLRDVGDAVKKLVIDLIRAAIQAAILNLILKAFGVNSGGSSGAFGAILKGLIGSSGQIKGFAEGGIVTKPTLAMIGEGGEKEAIIPLSKLSAIMGSGGGGGGGKIISKVRGSDLLFVEAREIRKQLRG